MLLFRFDATACQLQPWATYGLPDGRILGALALRTDGLAFAFIVQPELELEARRGSERSKTLLGICRLGVQEEDSAQSSAQPQTQHLRASFAGGLQLSQYASLSWLQGSSACTKCGVCMDDGAGLGLAFVTGCRSSG